MMSSHLNTGSAVYEVDELVHETCEAWLMQIDNEEVWLPKSQVDFCEMTHEVDVPNWLAKEKGLL